MITALLTSSALGASAFSTIFSVYVLSSEKREKESYAARHQPCRGPQQPQTRWERLRQRQEMLQCRVHALENVYAKMAARQSLTNPAVSAPDSPFLNC